MRPLLAAALLGAFFVSASGQTTNAPPAPNALPAAPVSHAIPMVEIIARASALLNQYPAPARPAAPDPSETSIREEMKTMAPRLPLLTSEAQLMLAQNASLEKITSLEKWADSFARTVGTKAGVTDGWLQSVAKRNADLDKQLIELDQERQSWDDTAAALQKDPAAGAAYAQQVAAVQVRLTVVRADVVARQKSLLQLQMQAATTGQKVSAALAALETARTGAISRLFEASAPPVWSGAPWPTATGEDALTWSRQLETLTTYAGDEPGRFLAHLLLFAALLGVFGWLHGQARRMAPTDPEFARAVGIFQTPLSTALLLSLGASPLFYYPVAPQLLNALLGAGALIPCVVVLRRLIEPRLFPILYALAVFFLLEEFRSTTSPQGSGARLFFLVEMLAALAFLGWLLLRFRHAGPLHRFGRIVRFGARVAFLLLSAAWLAEVLGFLSMANLLGGTVQRAATLALALYAGIRIVEALFIIALRLQPLAQLGMVRQRGPEILHTARRLLVGTAVLAWAVIVLEELPWSANVNAAVFGFLAKYDNQGALVLKVPGKLLVAGLIVWGIFQISRLIRFTLETDFYPRLRLGAGLPYAISTSLHYALLVVAFITATAVLGIDMTKFTILVSALGVGVGFGLQNIINNFVSGLILLFERPVKIGDTILTGSDTGTVERIGIRASVLRTASGTEVIVPNGTLISSNVTNWTLSSRERIILIPLNVPRGPELTHLTGLLTTTAAAHPLVLKNPTPQVLAQALGPNLSLELRAWIGPAADWTQVRSELVLAIEAALAKEKIALA